MFVTFLWSMQNRYGSNSVDHFGIICIVPSATHEQTTLRIVLRTLFPQPSLMINSVAPTSGMFFSVGGFCGIHWLRFSMTLPEHPLLLLARIFSNPIGFHRASTNVMRNSVRSVILSCFVKPFRISWKCKWGF